MRVLTHNQGGPEWIRARLGIPTASRFDRILTAKTLKPSAQAAGYIEELVAEWAIGEPLDAFSSGFMDRGTGMEEEAAEWYEGETGIVTQKVGLCLRDDGRVGCSPDRLVGEDGGLEIKCPSAKTHVGYLLGRPGIVAEEYLHQVQGALWLTGRAWWDVLAYHPTMPPILWRVAPDPRFHAALDAAMAVFLADLEAAKDRLRSMGHVSPLEAPEPAPEPEEPPAPLHEPVPPAAPPIDFTCSVHGGECPSDCLDAFPFAVLFAVGLLPMLGGMA